MGYGDANEIPESAEFERYEGEGCRPTSGNDASKAHGLTGNARGDARRWAGASAPGKIKRLLLH